MNNYARRKNNMTCTQNFSSTTWVLLYFVDWAICLIWTIVTSYAMRSNKKAERIRDAGLSTTAFLGGMIGVGFVSVGLERDIGLFILLVLAFSASLISLTSLAVGNKVAAKKKR